MSGAVLGGRCRWVALAFVVVTRFWTSSIKSMTVPMVQIGIVRMRMDQRFVRMLMGVRLRSIPGRIMLVLVMFIVPVLVGMNEALMPVNMTMPLADVEPDTDRHHDRRHPEC